MSDTEKALTYEEAKELCRDAFDGGVIYGTESMRYGVNAVAYDWEHWLKKNEHRFIPTPTTEDVLREFAEKVIDSQIPGMHPTYKKAIAEYAKKLRLAGDE